MENKTKEPTDAELAGACGLTEEAFQKVKHITMEEMVCLAALTGQTIAIRLVPKPLKRKGSK